MAAGHGGKPLHGSGRDPAGAAKVKDSLLSAGQLAGFEGKLHVDLIKAKNLVKADMMGKSDPYAVLKFGKQKEKTNTIRNTLEPQWDFSTDFQVPDGNADKLLVEVFDSDKLGKDKSLGKVELSLADLETIEGQWFSLQGVKSGTVNNCQKRSLLCICSCSLYLQFM
jgi:Ca2+-dependent lipid-binding protein